jgi:DNA-binding response OmpR family regulator
MPFVCPVCGNEMVWLVEGLPELLREIEFTKKERQFVEILWQHSPEFVSRERLMTGIYQLVDHEPFDNILRTFAWSVRKKLKGTKFQVIGKAGHGHALRGIP